MKARSLSKLQKEELLTRLNAYTEQLDTPARVEELNVEFAGKKIETSFRLMPTGNMDAVKWNTVSDHVERMIRKFVVKHLEYRRTRRKVSKGRS